MAPDTSKTPSGKWELQQLAVASETIFQRKRDAHQSGFLFSGDSLIALVFSHLLQR